MASRTFTIIPAAPVLFQLGAVPLHSRVIENFGPLSRHVRQVCPAHTSGMEGRQGPTLPPTPACCQGLSVFGSGTFSLYTRQNPCFGVPRPSRRRIISKTAVPVFRKVQRNNQPTRLRIFVLGSHNPASLHVTPMMLVEQAEGRFRAKGACFRRHTSRSFQIADAAAADP